MKHIVHVERNFTDDKLNGADIRTLARGWDISKHTDEYDKQYWLITDGMHEYAYYLDDYPSKDTAWEAWERVKL